MSEASFNFYRRMYSERITDDIYVFTSERYAQVTAGVIATSQGGVVFDTLVFPEETLALRNFVRERLGMPVRYVINSHFHADHTTGTCFFPESTVIAHDRCRQLLDQRGRASMENAKRSSPELDDVQLVLPTLVFDRRLTLHCGNKTLLLWSSPGHSPDSIVCMVAEDQVLFAGDTLMPLPYFVDDHFDNLLISLEALRHHNYETVVQGHGEVVLRGEVEGKIESDIRYLRSLEEAVVAAMSAPDREAALAAIDVEDCGKDRILLNGMAEQLHRQNVMSLAAERLQQQVLMQDES